MAHKELKEFKDDLNESLLPKHENKDLGEYALKKRK
jgi:hypothetical protein